MEKVYGLYQVDFITKINGSIKQHYILIVSDNARNAISETRKILFNTTGKHAFRCKARLAGLKES